MAQFDTKMATHAPKAGLGQGITVAIAGFFPVMAIVSLAPVVPTLFRHFADVAGAHNLVPLVVTAPGLLIALLSPFMGIAADTYGRRRLILAATLLYGAIGVLPFFLAHLPAILASRLLLGAAEAAILTVTNVLIADYFSTSGRRIWLTVQAIIGPALGVTTIMASGLLTGWRWNGAFLIYLVAFPMLLAMYIFLFEPASSRQPAEPAPQANAFPWKQAAAFAPVTLFAAVLYYVYIVQAGLAFGAVGMNDPGRLGGLLGLSSIGVPVGGAIFGVISRRSHIMTVLSVMFAFLGLGMLGIALSDSVTVMTASCFVQQIGAGMCVASLIFWVSGLLSPEQRGRGFGVWTCAFFLGQFVSPAIAGPVETMTGSILKVFMIAAIAAFVGALGCILARMKASAARI
jgi:MFS family permease